MDNVYQALRAPTATRALQLIEAYHRHASSLHAQGLDLDVYSEALQLFDELQRLAADLPEAGAAWVELLISRIEFTQALWVTRGKRISDASVRFLGAAHLQAIAFFRQRCADAYLDRAGGLH